MPDRTDFNGWQKLNSLGRGGQGEVFLARKTAPPAPIPLEQLLEVIHTSGSLGYADKRRKAAEEFVSLVRMIATNVLSEDHAPVGALKISHPIQDKVATEKAMARMERELLAMKAVTHSSLVRILEARPDEKWFVMEYFSRGTLSGHLGRFSGDVSRALRTFRPLVAAASELHKNGYVHRDIKPANVFVADDSRLVLGDFGLVIDPSAIDARLTETYENVGSRDWMPGWATGMRMDEVKPNFDVFSLGKLLWAMVSGREILRLWYFSHPKYPQFDLERIYPENPDMRWVTRILRQCVVEHETDCLNDAGELLVEVDKVIGALQYGGQVLRKENAPIRCRMCGIGECIITIPGAGGPMVLHCGSCGYEQKFTGVKGKLAWE
jgi:serine/threonine protein kinase